MFRSLTARRMISITGMRLGAGNIAPLCDLAPKPKVVEADKVKLTKQTKVKLKRSAVLAEKELVLRSKNEDAEKRAKEDAEKRAERLLERPWEPLGKLPINSRLIYIQERFPLTARLPEEKPLDTVHRIGREYKALLDADKAPYEELAAANKAKREAACAKIQNRRITPYAIFVSDVFAALSKSRKPGEKLSMIDASREAAAKWNSSSAKEKQPYNDRAKALKDEALAEVYLLLGTNGEKESPS